MEFDILLRLVGVMNLEKNYCVQRIFIGENPFYVILLRKQINIDEYSNIYRPISFKLGMMIETTKVYILIPVWMTFKFILGHSCMINHKLLHPFSHKFLYQFG